MPATAISVGSEIMVEGGRGRNLYGHSELVPEGTTVEEAVRLAGLNYTVIKRPIQFADGAQEEIRKLQVLTREDNPSVVWGAVTPRYQIAQNPETFQITEFMAQEAGMKVLAAGQVDSGRKAWMMLELPEALVVAGDAVKPNVLSWNTHDGSGSLAIANTALRIACTNQLPFLVHGAKQSIKIRHTGDIAAKMAAAHDALGITNEYFEKFKALGDTLAGRQLTDRRLKRILEKLYPEGTTDRQRANAQERREAVRRLVNEAPNLEGHHGTEWALVNAVAEHADWNSNRARDRVARMTYMSPDVKIKNTALALIAKMN